MEYRCRVVGKQYSCHKWNDFSIDDVFYSPRVTLKEADALVALYDPEEELLAFDGPKVWFTYEPSWHYHFTRHPVGRKLMVRLNGEEHLWYGNPNPLFRVPHPTFRGNLSIVRNKDRRQKAVACVSNFGGNGWFLKPHFRLRNRFILTDGVELHGNARSWDRFRWFPKLWETGQPPNFRGRAPGNGFHDHVYLEFLSTFHAAVCLENRAEPYYFTEKFVNAARGGCIPVYHAHPTVRDSYLQGARWVDPIDHGFCPRRTIDYALNQDPDLYREANDAWLQSGVLDPTDDLKSFQAIHGILKEKLANHPSQK